MDTRLCRAYVFYDTLGEDLATELVDWFNQVDATYRSDLRELNESNFQRFDAKLEQRLAQRDVRWERRFAKLEAKLEQRLAEQDVLRCRLAFLPRSPLTLPHHRTYRPRCVSHGIDFALQSTL